MLVSVVILCSVVSLRVSTKMSTQAPTFTQPLQSVVALEGSAATFEAQVSGKENSHVLHCTLLYVNIHYVSKPRVNPCIRPLHPI